MRATLQRVASPSVSPHTVHRVRKELRTPELGATAESRFGHDFSRVRVARTPDEGTPDAGTPPASGPVPAAAPFCMPVGLSRADFLTRAGTGLSEFGLTTLDTSLVTYPQVRLADRRVQPTTAALSEVPSVYVGADIFEDPGDTVPVGGGGRCPEGRYRRRFIISSAGAARIQAGEQEHCNDFQYAFDISLGMYRDAVNRVSASGRRFASEEAAKRALERTVGVAPDDWGNVFRCLALKSLARDRRRYDWHTPRARHDEPDRRCERVNAMVGEHSLREVGRHPSSEIIRDCGETPAGRGAPR